MKVEHWRTDGQTDIGYCSFCDWKKMSIKDPTMLSNAMPNKSSIDSCHSLWWNSGTTYQETVDLDDPDSMKNHVIEQVTRDILTFDMLRVNNIKQYFISIGPHGKISLIIGGKVDPS